MKNKKLVRLTNGLLKSKLSDIQSDYIIETTDYIYKLEVELEGVEEHRFWHIYNFDRKRREIDLFLLTYELSDKSFNCQPFIKLDQIPLSIEFMEYLIDHRYELKRKLTLDELITLDNRYFLSKLYSNTSSLKEVYKASEKNIIKKIQDG